MSAPEPVSTGVDVAASDLEALNELGSICVIGLGLIGGSLLLALRAAGYQGRLLGVARSANTLERALQRGLVDEASSELAPLVGQADLVMLAVPMLAMRAQLRAIAPHLPVQTILTDAGSVKHSFISEAREELGSLARVVPGHPIAGSEKNGVDSGFAELFVGRRVLLTPTRDCQSSALRLVSALWRVTGARVESLSAEHHDQVLARTSHLPHVLAYSLVELLASQQTADEIFRYAAGGFRDFTRIAASDPVMWRDICLTNGEAIGQALDDYIGHLQQVRAAIKRGDGDAIEQGFRRAKRARDAHS